MSRSPRGSYLTDAQIIDSEFAGGSAAVTGLRDRGLQPRRRLHRRLSHLVAPLLAEQGEASRKYADVKRHQWTDEELAAVWAEYRTHNLANRRGAEPLYYEDVEVGFEVPHIIKGPITLTSKIAFEMAFGAGGWFVGHELAMQLWEAARGCRSATRRTCPSRRWRSTGPTSAARRTSACPAPTRPGSSGSTGSPSCSCRGTATTA